MSEKSCENHELMEINWDDGSRTIDAHCKAGVIDLAEYPCPQDCPSFKPRPEVEKP